MSKTKLAGPLAYASGRILGQHEKVSARIMYGKQHLYVLHNPPTEWSDTQKDLRKSFGLVSYYAHVIMDTEGAKPAFEAIKRKQKRFVRTDHMVAHMLKELMLADESVAEKAQSAYLEWQQTEPLARAAVRDRHIIEAEEIAEKLMKL